MKTHLIHAVLALMTTGVSLAVTIHVSPNGADTPPFASAASATRSIQRAIAAATDGDVIRVAPGRYLETVDFLGKAVTVAGAGPETILDGGGTGPVVRITGGEGRGAVLDSIQITGGVAADGAAILVENASPTIQRTVIFGNRASGAGAGILVSGRQSNPLIRNNLIAGNDDSTPEITDAHQVFIDSGSSARLLNNTIVRGNGNAILVSGSNRPSVIANNILAWNGSTLRGGVVIGRGICDFSGSARIRYNLFYRNSRAAILTDVPGGGLEDIPLISDAEAILRRTRVARNFDANPRLERTPPRTASTEIRPENFRLRGGPAVNAGDPRPAFRNATGGRNTVGHTGGPLGWR